MDFALQSALLGAVMGTLVLAVSAFYGWLLSPSTNAYGWWGASFLIDGLAKAVLLRGADSWLVALSDVGAGFSAVLLLFGALSLAGLRLGAPAFGLGLAGAGGWTLVANIIRQNLHMMGLPFAGAAGLPYLGAAFALWRHSRSDRTDADRMVMVIMGLSGLIHLCTPVLLPHATLATWSMILSQFLSMLLAVGLLLMVLRHQQAAVVSEGRRADRLRDNLGEALGGVTDAVALFDAQGRMVTCNSLYRDIEPLMGTALDSGREIQLADGRWVQTSLLDAKDGGTLRIVQDVTSRRQAEQSMQDSLVWLKGVMDTVVDGIITIDQTGTVLTYNQGAAKIFGYGAAEVVGRNVSMLMPDPYRGEHDDYLARYLAGGAPRMIGIGRQVKGWRKDGTVFPLELSVSEMRQDGELTFIGVVRDITDRKRVEDALVESEQRFRDLAESASDWFWETDSDLVFTFVSGRVRQALGVGPAYFVGQAFRHFLARAEIQSEGGRVAALMDEQRAFRGFVYCHDLPGGEIKYVEMTGRASFDSAGMFQGYRGTATDITPIKRHQVEIQAQSTLRQAIIDNMSQGVAVFDSSERLIACNAQVRSLLDLPNQDHMSRLEDILLHMALQGEFGRGSAMTKAVRRLTRLRRHPNLVFEHLRPNGMAVEIHSSAMPGGGLILTMFDTTERKKAEDTLRDARDAAERGNRAKATFLANISHELRTPLNAIIGFSELMKHEIFGPLEPESYRNYIDDIHQSGQHLLGLINDILDMSKAEAGMTDLEETVVDMGQMVRDCVRLIERRAMASGIDLGVDLPANLPWLRGDERRLRQILLNLVSNAVKFTENGGEVRVAVRVGDDGMQVKVSDTGIGMSAEDLERVMEPFVQADTRLSRKYEGTGLGLPLTKALVAAHGGSMVLASQPNQGTIVTISFPAHRIVRNPKQAVAADEVLRRG